MSILDIVLSVLSVAGPVLVHLAHKSKNKIDDVVALAVGDQEAQDLVKALAARLQELREQANAPSDE